MPSWAFHGRTDHQERASQDRKVQEILPLADYTLQPSLGIHLLYIETSRCWSLVLERHEEVHLDHADDHARPRKGLRNLPLQTGPEAWLVVVQKGCFPRIASGSLRSLLLSQDPKARGEHFGLSQASETRNNILRYGGQHLVKGQRIHHSAGCKLLHTRTVLFLLFRNIDNLIGRAAHISFINNLEMVRTFVIAGKE